MKWVVLKAGLDMRFSIRNFPAALSGYKVKEKREVSVSASFSAPLIMGIQFG